MALEMGFPSVKLMLSMMSSEEYTEWMAYHYVVSGNYEKRQKEQNKGKVLRAQLGHLVVKKDDNTR